MTNIDIKLDIKFDRIKKIYKKFINCDNFNDELPNTKFLSDWDPGNTYANKISKVIKFPFVNSLNTDIIKYKNSRIELKNFRLNNLLLYKLNANKKNNIENLDLLITPDGTSSMFLLFLMMKNQNIKKIAIILPSYYLAEVYCKIFNLKYDFIWLDGFKNFSIPIKTIINNNYDAIWMTSPLFGTSVFFSQDDINKIQFLINKKIYCFFDESMYEYKNELIKYLLVSEKTFFIYSPHKSISVNGSNIKFSAIISKKLLILNLNRYQIFYPNIILDKKDNIGINHFLYPNYDKCFEVFKEHFDKNLKSIKKIILTKNNIFINEQFIHTGYITIYILKDIKNIYSFVTNIIKDTGYMIIPSDRHYYFHEKYFSFRINLLLNLEELIDGLTKIFKLL